MNKILIICLCVLCLLSVTACTTKGSNNNIASSTNNANNAGNVNTGDNSNNANTAIASTNNGNNVQSISDIQKPENVGKSVTVQGRVVSTLQSATFHISGYKIQDSTGTIDVSSPKQPQVNSTVTVTGVIYQSRFFGLVINETG